MADATIDMPGRPSFGRRFLAYVFDILPITLLVVAIASALFDFDDLMRASIARPDDTGTRAWFVLNRTLVRNASALLWVLAGAYFDASSLRGTPGKYLQDLQVVTWTGAPISQRQAWLRNGAKVLSALPLFLGFAWAAFDRHGQAWHDKVAHTYVVRR